uniref:Uncharacterized protein n=1 Tax=Aegilops tauschii subsp. strangulata TaxID=200361 RepID=A0A453BJG9_AEGTS
RVKSRTESVPVPVDHAPRGGRAFVARNPPEAPRFACPGLAGIGMHWCPGIGPRVRSFLRDYDALQSLALALIYLQIGCALIGSLGALFNGVLVINLVIGLFAVVAIESSSQRLGRTYAVLLFFAIVLDVAWFILFSHAIWNSTPDEKYGQLFVFSLRLALLMQTIGFSVRFLSSFIWIQMYRLGVSSSTPTYYEANDARNSFLSPRSNSVRRGSMADDILGGSIYDPSYYSSLFEDVRNNACNHQGDKQSGSNDSGSTSAGQSPRLKSFGSRSFLSNDVSRVQSFEIRIYSMFVLRFSFLPSHHYLQ